MAKGKVVSIYPGSPWRNWGRSVSAHSAYAAKAGSVAQVQQAVAFARDRALGLRPIGAGHSFAAIAATDGVQLDLAAVSGLISVAASSVTVGAGTYLHELPAILAPHSLALENMGDIDQQSVAGSISTGTHGTGGNFGGLSTQVEAMTLVTADGALLRVSENENPELLPAVCLSLGALGVIVDVTLRCVPNFMLHAVERAEPLEDVLDNWEQRVNAVDHFEFYWFAHTSSALTKSNTRLPGDTTPKRQNRLAAWIDDEFMPNNLYRVLCELGVRAPSTTPPLNRLSEHLVATREVVDSWHSVFTSPRRVRFRELEYAIPRDKIPEALREIRATIQRKGWRITFPVEVRAAASDQIWLSTAYERETGYIAVHRYYREDPTEYFEAVEAIMREFGGRPHWGKMHNSTAAELRAVYPRFDDFLAVRERLDPERLFANDYLCSVLGL
ncbi:MAG: D-arabinono-1,4-lactone oxidase [Rhodoglobus sp.]